ncbi:hypothetical protein ACFQBQ_15260 [Granulicella cerasi]|uniref:Tetratricopeptide repeat protein n=1 Tax=Granulicella cerasi TaxID=741063 RepID=A0ABW1ZCN8_9BACT|nr:hypothetical protein [Granulicella cerasi]
MKKVVLASLLTLAVAAPAVPLAVAQTPAAPAAGQVQMSEQEYAVYNNAATQTTPAAKAAAFEAYLKQFPNSAVKNDVLNQMLFAYNQAGDQANTVATADRVIAADPNNLRALTLEVYYRRADADKLTDPAAKAAALEPVAKYAQQGLNATKPDAMAQADFDTLKKATTPTFDSALADAALAKKDNATAITALKAEIAADPDDTTKPSPVLQDVFTLAQAYYTSTPPDYLNCAWYGTRALVYAPDAYKPQIQPTALYCYQKYHGSKDGFDQLQALVKTSIDPPATLTSTIKPAPKPEDYVKQIIATTPDLATLALSDKEFILQNGTPEDADKVFSTIKGKAVELPGVVVSATDSQVQLSVSDDAIQGKTADFTVNLKTPATKVPAAGDKITVDGTYASYTQKPLNITMSDATIVPAKKPAAPVHHTAPRKR